MFLSCHEARVFSWPWMAIQGLFPLWVLVCHLLLGPSSYRASSQSHEYLVGFAHKIFTPKSSSWGRFNDGHLHSLADSGDGSWLSALGDVWVKPRAQAGMVSFVFQAGGLTSLLHSLKSIFFPGHYRGRKPLTLGQGRRRFRGRGAGSYFDSSVRLGGNCCADQGETLWLWKCWDQHKTEIPSGSKIAAHHKHSLLLWLVLLWFLLPPIFDSDCFNLLLSINDGNRHGWNSSSQLTLNLGEQYPSRDW